jgi:hypothetical protein
VSRLDYAPKLKEIQITDIKKGLGVFTPKPDRAVSFAALKTALKRAGYTLDSAQISVAGTLARDGSTWTLVNDSTGQRFVLEGANVEKVLAGAKPDTRLSITGDWKTSGTGATSREVISPDAPENADGASKSERGAAASKVWATSSATNASQVTTAGASREADAPVVRFTAASYEPPAARAASYEPASSYKPAASYRASAIYQSSPPDAFSGSLLSLERPSPRVPLAPIRVTSPGLTVYKGGAFAPRLYFVRQHAGALEVNRQVLNLSVTYTPTPTLQLEAELPLARTAFDDGATSGASFGLGNLTLWGKYRFFRTVKTYGDRQAAFRFGLELPTGSKRAPLASQVNASAFLRQQLTPISGGLSPHFDLSFSQAGGRFIFGGNVEAVLRSGRAGFRMGHELRVNTDVEYVLLPRDYDVPGRELFAILETSFVRRGLGRVGGATVAASGSTEFYLAPGLQYAAAPRVVLEGSFQFPVARRAGAQALRTDGNLLLGVRYLF